MLILVRHGESVLNKEGRLVGRLNPQLTPRGELQAAAAGTLLGEVGELRCSPLERTRRTAELLETGRPVVIEERCIELDYGELDGTPLVDVDPSLWERWLNDASFVPPGGESLEALGQRMAGLVEELFSTPGELARDRDADAVVVSHVSPIKAAVAWALGVDPLIAWRMQLATGSVTRIDLGRQGPQLVGFNQVAALG